MLLLVSALCLVVPALGRQSPPPLAVAVYYEALCPDSLYFVVNQLSVTWSAVPDLINVTFVPWGKARTWGDGNIYCQHGPVECWANRLHTCLITHAADDDVRMRAVSCLLANRRSRWKTSTCVSAAGLSWGKQYACSTSEASLKKELEYGRMTRMLKPPLTFVPTVTIDGSQGTPEEQDQMVYDLLNFVCSTWKKRSGQTPPGCM